MFWWNWDVDELKRDLELDGKLVLISNVSYLTPEQLVAHFKDRADIERGFRIMKNQLDIAPVYHPLPDRIRAHTFICFLVLVIQCALRYRLQRSPLGLSPEELLYRLRSASALLGNKWRRARHGKTFILVFIWRPAEWPPREGARTQTHQGFTLGFPDKVDVRFSADSLRLTECQKDLIHIEKWGLNLLRQFAVTPPYEFLRFLDVPSGYRIQVDE